MKQNLDEVIRRTYQYFYADGLVEMGVGGLFLVVSLLLFLWGQAESGSVGYVFLALALPVLVIGGGYALQRAVESLKTRMTYRRSGFLEYRREKREVSRWTVPLGTLLIMILLIYLPDHFAQMPFVEGGLLFLVLAYLGYRLALPRFFLLGGLAGLTGLAASIFIEGDLPGSTVTFAVTGLILVISGGIVLGRYLATHPVQEQVES